MQRFQRPYEKSMEYLRKTFDCTYNIQEGSVRSGKTLDNIIAFAMNLEESNDILHLAVAPTFTSARAIFFDGDGMGLRHFPEWQRRVEIIDGRKVEFPQRIFETHYEDREALMLVPAVDSDMPIKYIIPFGADNMSSHKGYRGWSIGMVLGTEIDMWHPNTIQEIQSRTVASSYRKFFLDFNPNNPRHFIYAKLDEWSKSLGGYNYIHKTLLDNPILSEKQIKVIKSEYDPTSIDYRRYILGERVSAYGLIYKVRDYNIFDEINYSDYSSYIITADIGENMSATVFQVQAYNHKLRCMDVIKEYYHRNADVERSNEIKLPNHYAEDFLGFIQEAIREMKSHPARVQSDLDLTFMREFELMAGSFNLGDVTLRDVIKREIDERISTGIVYLFKNKLRFHRSCRHTIEAFEQATYDPKQEEKGKYVRLDNPSQHTKIDPIDATEYGFTYYERELKYGAN